MKSLDELYKENENFIYFVASKYKNYSSMEDLYQAGRLGFVKAYNNYDIKSNCKFTSFAYKYIMGEMLKVIREDKSIKISKDISSVKYKIEKAYSLLSQKLMKEPTIEEVANYLEIPEFLVEEAIISSNKVYSIDEPLNEEGRELTYQDIIGKETNINELIYLKELLTTLDSEERKIILNRYLEGYTQEETSSSIGISQVQVSRKEQKILKKLNQKMVA